MGRASGDEPMRFLLDMCWVLRQVEWLLGQPAAFGMALDRLKVAVCVSRIHQVCQLSASVHYLLQHEVQTQLE